MSSISSAGDATAASRESSSLVRLPAAAAPRKNLFVDFLQGGLASCGAVVISNPLEVVKIRLQLQGELARQGQYVKHYDGVLSAFKVVARTEGVLALQKGLITAFVYQLAMNGTRLGLYDYLRRSVSSHFEGAEKNFFVNISLAAVSGVVGAWTGSPFYLIKTRLQSAGGLVGAQHAYSGLWSGITSIVRTEGVRGLWRGADAAMLRTAVGSSTQLMTYDIAKRSIMGTGYFGDSATTYVVASMVTGLCVATTMNPFDVISTRLYNQSGKNELYTGPIDALTKIYRVEGARGFFKGWLAHYMRIGPHTIFTFLFWEQIKKVSAHFGY